MPWDTIVEKASLAVFSIVLLFLLWQQTKELSDFRDVLREMIHAVDVTITELSGCTRELKDRQVDMNRVLDDDIAPTLRELIPVLKRLQRLLE